MKRWEWALLIAFAVTIVFQMAMPPLLPQWWSVAFAPFGGAAEPTEIKCGLLTLFGL